MILGKIVIFLCLGEWLHDSLWGSYCVGREVGTERGGGGCRGRATTVEVAQTLMAHLPRLFLNSFLSRWKKNIAADLG